MGVYYFGSVSDMPTEARDELERFLELGVPVFTGEQGDICHPVTLGTRQSDGVRLTVINLLRNPTLHEACMQCNLDSQKARNIMACGEAEIALTNGRGYAVLSCTAEVLTDEAAKQEKWEDWMAEFHPDGPSSPDYAVLRFVPHDVRAML